MFSTKLNEKIKVVFHENKNMNEYIAKIEIPIPKGPPEFIFIIDSSGSMNGYFEVIIKNIIPDVLKKGASVIFQLLFFLNTFGITSSITSKTSSCVA